MSEEEMFFGFLQQYIEDGNFPDYSGEYPNPYELTIEDSELILNAREKQNKEIERLKTELQETKEHLGEYLHEQEEENKRLNNIINELEKDVETRLMSISDDMCDDALEEIKRTTKIAVYQVVLGKLQELKGSDK